MWKGEASGGAADGRFGEPGAGLALGFGDLAGGHLLGDLGAAFLAAAAAAQGGEVEPFVRLDEIDIEAVRAGLISDAELVERVRIARRGLGEAALDQELGRLQTASHSTCPLVCVSGAGLRRRYQTNG